MGYSLCDSRNVVYSYTNTHHPLDRKPTHPSKKKRHPMVAQLTTRKEQAMNTEQKLALLIVAMALMTGGTYVIQMKKLAISIVQRIMLGFAAGSLLVAFLYVALQA